MTSTRLIGDIQPPISSSAGAATSSLSGEEKRDCNKLKNEIDSMRKELIDAKQQLRNTEQRLMDTHQQLLNLDLEEDNPAPRAQLTRKNRIATRFCGGILLVWLMAVTIVLIVALKINVNPRCDNPASTPIMASASTSGLSIDLYVKENGSSEPFNFNAHQIQGETCNPNGWGCAIIANNGNWPATIGRALSQTLFTLAVNGANLPHHHPNGDEVLHVIAGTIEVYRIEPNSVNPTSPHRAILTPGMSVIFPRGHFHFQHNVGNSSAKYISTLNSENAGVNTLGVRTCELPTGALLSSFGLTTAGEIQKLCMNLPDARFPGQYLDV